MHRHKNMETTVCKARVFCKHCTLHGFYYFSEKRHWLVYTIWSAIIISSVTLCIFLCHMIWQKFVVDPTFTVVETTHLSTAQIPFPAVAVCDTERVYGPNTANITNILYLRSFTDQQIAAFYASFSDIKDNDYEPPDYLSRMHNTLQDLGYTFAALMDMFAKPCDELVVQCTWRAKIHNCSDMFRKVFTVAGYCCQFDITFFRDHAERNTSFVAGVEMTEALGIIINAQKISYKGVVSEGYTSVYVYDETTNITILDSPTTITPTALFDVKIFVWAIESSDDVESLAIRDRKCLLSQDMVSGRYLYEECLSINILRKVVSHCRCLPFQYSAEKLQLGDLQQCTWDRLICIYQTIEKVKSEIKDIVFKNDCLQRCNYVQYATKIEYLRHRRRIRTRLANESYSEVFVHHGSKTCFKYKREVLYSWDQMLANLGGIFGLCLGGSIISLIELVWFLLELIFEISKSTGKRRTAPKKRKNIFTLTEQDLNIPKREKVIRFKFVN